MKNGLARFDFYLTQLEQLLEKASNDENPAQWLFVNNARTPLFMLEALAKLYSDLHNNAMFNNLKERFKGLEDGLGDIDYYDAFVKQFSGQPQIPGLAIGYLQRKKEENTQSLNDILVKKKWIGPKANRVKKIRKKLQDADWMKEREEINAIQTFYKNAIVQINVFYKSTNGEFTELENQVHEFRRKLRWLSIYPQALGGCIQLTESGSPEETLQKYLVPEIVNSPFNKMPDAGSNRHFLLLEKNYFLALSWMISELGKLKDAGLGIMAVQEALEHHKDIVSATAESIYKTAASGKTSENILSKASAISQQFFQERNLEKLVKGVSMVVKQQGPLG